LAEVLKAEVIASDGHDHFMGSSYPVLRDLIIDIERIPIDFSPGGNLPDDFASIHWAEHQNREEEVSDELL